MGMWVSISLPMMLRGRAVTIEVRDHYIQDGDLDDDGFAAPEELVFDYRVFDVEEEAELLKLTPEEREQIHKAILEDLQNLCE